MIYLMQTRKHYYKVGKGAAPTLRRDTLQTGCPFRINLIKSIKVWGDENKLEKEFHYMLSERRKIGEWFYLPEKQIVKMVLDLFDDLHGDYVARSQKVA